jgi:hypothetical protein
MTTPDLAALQAQVESLKRTYTDLTRKPAALFDVGNAEKAQQAINTLNDQIELARERASRLEEGFGGIYENIVGIVAELKKKNTQADLATKAFSKIQSITQKLKYDQQGLNELSLKELKNAQKKLDSLQSEAREQAASIMREKNLESGTEAQIAADIRRKLLLGSITEEEAAIVRGAKEGFPVFEEMNTKLKKRLELEEKVQSGLGVTGGLLKGINKIPILGDMFDASDAVEEMEAHLREVDKDGKQINSNTSALKLGLKNIKGQIIDGLLNPANLITGAFTLMVDALIKGDTATGDLAKEFNITYKEAAGVREELIQMGNSSLNVALNARALQESMVAVGKSLGSNAMLNKEDLETFTELREMAGYTNEELIGIQKLTLATGGNLKDNTKQFLGTVSALNAQNKLTINEKQLLKEVSNTSAAIKLSVGGTTKGLAEAAFKAKELGINLDQADRIAESLLNFESSITAELEAELLTGKDLNLEKARLLALNGDIAGASAEVLKQVKGSAEFTKMNRIQQEALAKAVGMSREDLAASLVEREALKNIGVEEAASAKEKFDLLVKEKGYAAAVAELGDEQYATQLKQQSIQERFNQSVEKLKEIFISISEPILRIISPLMDLVTTILPAINLLLTPVVWLFKSMADAVQGFTDLIHGDLKSGLGGVLQIAQSIATVWGGIVLGAKLLGKEILKNISLQGIFGNLLKKSFWKSLATAITSIFTGNSILGPFGIPVAIAAAAGLTSLAVGAFSKGDDVMSEGGYGNRTLLTPKGSIALNNEDTLIAGTNLGGKRKTESVPQQNTDMSPLLEEMRAMRQEQARSNSKPTIVENSVNGTRFGTAVAINTYKIQ